MAIQEQIDRISNEVNTQTDLIAQIAAAINNIPSYSDGYESGHNDGYEEGSNEGYSQAENNFWDVIQNYGNRVFYEYAFYGWDCEYIRPKYKVTVGSDIRPMCVFSNNSSLKKVESAYFDFSNHKVNSGSGYTHYNTFSYCTSLEEIEDVGLKTGNYGSTFAHCYSLRTIAIIRVAETDTWTNTTFNRCYALENLTIEGTIGKNNFDVSYSTKLTHDSLMSIINALKDYSGSNTTYTVTLGTTNLAKLTDAEKAIATGKGWTLA